jgi:hypothetical protein
MVIVLSVDGKQGDKKARVGYSCGVWPLRCAFSHLIQHPAIAVGEKDITYLVTIHNIDSYGTGIPNRTNA